jgi:hypothetical protein
VKIFDLAAARTGLRDHEAAAAGFDPFTVESAADDHKAYYPGSHRIAMRLIVSSIVGQLSRRRPNRQVLPPLTGLTIT